MRVFLDANILFSAAKSAGAVRALLTLLEQSGHECCVDALVIEEARRNLGGRGTGSDFFSRTVIVANETGEGAARGPGACGVLPLPAKDRQVPAAAIQQSCDALVTGNQTHFGTLYGRTIHGVTIHSPRSLAEALLL